GGLDGFPTPPPLGRASASVALLDVALRPKAKTGPPPPHRSEAPRRRRGAPRCCAAPSGRHGPPLPPERWDGGLASYRRVPRGEVGPRDAAEELAEHGRQLGDGNADLLHRVSLPDRYPLVAGLTPLR